MATSSMLTSKVVSNEPVGLPIGRSKVATYYYRNEAEIFRHSADAAAILSPPSAKARPTLRSNSARETNQIRRFVPSSAVPGDRTPIYCSQDDSLESWNESDDSRGGENGNVTSCGGGPNYFSSSGLGLGGSAEGGTVTPVKHSQMMSQGHDGASRNLVVTTEPRENQGPPDRDHTDSPLGFQETSDRWSHKVPLSSAVSRQHGAGYRSSADEKIQGPVSGVFHAGGLEVFPKITTEVLSPVSATAASAGITSQHADVNKKSNDAEMKPRQASASPKWEQNCCAVDPHRDRPGQSEAARLDEFSDVKEFSIEGTDCGSLLSRNSSDGDSTGGVVNRRRPPLRNKMRRRSLVSFPHHFNPDELKSMQRRKTFYGGSSSDENRSSGHATMSDGHTSSSPPADTLPRHTHQPAFLHAVPEDDSCFRVSTNLGKRAAPSKTVNRQHCLKGEVLGHAAGLDDIKMAIEQLTLRSHSSKTSYSTTSTFSSLSTGSETGTPARRLIRQSSLETVNTNITSADEFVWVDSYNRLVELQQLPWTNQDVLRVLQEGRLKDNLERVSMEAIPRLSYLLQRALVRISREAQRLAKLSAICSKREICSALRIVLSPALADSCIKACLRGATMFTVSGADAIRQSKSARAGLHLSVGKFHRWMTDVRLGRFIHEYAAVYLTAGLENLLEEMMLQCLPADNDTLLTASVLEQSIADNSDLWGLLQPYAHLNAGRIATGALVLPRYPPSRENDLNSSRTSSVEDCNDKNLEQSLLTTCIGSIKEVKQLLHSTLSFHTRHSTAMPGSTANSGKHSITWSSCAIHTIFYYMRCSQLEHTEQRPARTVQELVYERPYIVLPPLIEWVRVANSHAEYRQAVVVDKDDVVQAARLLLPGVDCPVRLHGFEEMSSSLKATDDLESSRSLKIHAAFQMLTSGRADLIPHALQLLPSTKINTVNNFGLTALMLAAIRGDDSIARTLLEAGSDANTETPPAHSIPGVYSNPETQYWTALTYASVQGHVTIAKLLLDYGANVEGGASMDDEKCTETPLQVASASGNLEMVSLLLAHGARPFLSTVVRDSLSYSSSAQKGCYSPVAVAASHGQGAVLHALLSHPLHSSVSGNSDILSLEEMLAEGSQHLTSERRKEKNNMALTEKLQFSKLNKSQVKALQDAMYQCAENGHIEIALNLRNLGVPWTLHCWMQTVSTAYEQALESVTDRLLQDFLQLWGPDDSSPQFVDECLPLLFDIFRGNRAQNEGTKLLLADIFSTCYGKEPIKATADVSSPAAPRIDPKFVNNPELSDVQFRVEGRIFYGHKIVLITASPRFKSMLNAKLCDGNPPVIQINDIRYDVFQMVMNFLYKGSCEGLNIDYNDVLELMAAANFFQLEGLLRFCEARCAKLVDLDNIVSTYIHAKVYNAVHLLEYCQGFLLQNMVALLTYDDSVRRLIFSKRLHNHDVLTGLLLTLQSRIKNRLPSKNKFI